MNEYAKDTNTFDNPLITLSQNSTYYDTDVLISKLTKNLAPTKIPFNVIYINIQSLSPKFDDLKHLIATLQENGIVLNFTLICETFLHVGNVNLFDLPGYNFIYKNRVSRNRGDVAIYAKSNIDKLRDDLSIFEEGEFESSFI
jgi:hypothetical protein